MSNPDIGLACVVFRCWIAERLVLLDIVYDIGMTPIGGLVRLIRPAYVLVEKAGLGRTSEHSLKIITL